MSQTMERRGLFFKAMQTSGEVDWKELELLGGALQGVGWSREKDTCPPTGCDGGQGGHGHRG